jgi:hypothetical protein
MCDNDGIPVRNNDLILLSWRFKHFCYKIIPNVDVAEFGIEPEPDAANYEFVMSNQLDQEIMDVKDMNLYKIHYGLLNRRVFVNSKSF